MKGMVTAVDEGADPEFGPDHRRYVVKLDQVTAKDRLTRAVKDSLEGGPLNTGDLIEKGKDVAAG